MYYITKVVNNNIVCAVDENKNEAILRGLGLGFGKKTGERVSTDKIEKIYTADGDRAINRLGELFKEISPECIEVCTQIIARAEKQLGKPLSKNLLIPLSDHIDFAVKRKERGLEYKNALLSEIRSFYFEEYKIGRQALDLIYERLGERLSEDEAGFIALHIVNAELDTGMSDMFKITELIQAIEEIVQKYYGMELDRETSNYGCFIAYLKFFAQKTLTNSFSENTDEAINKVIRESCENDYRCAVKIRGFISAKYNKSVCEDELIFLTMHLKRITE